MRLLAAAFAALLLQSACDTRSPPTQEERAATRAAEYRGAYQQGLRFCHEEYPTAEDLLVAQGWTYDECAKAMAAIFMQVGEKYR